MGLMLKSMGEESFRQKNQWCFADLSFCVRSTWLTLDDRRLTQDDGEVSPTLDDGAVSQTLDDWRVTKTQDDWRVLIINHVTIVTGCVSRVDDIYMADFFFCRGRISMYHVMWWLDHSFFAAGQRCVSTLTTNLKKLNGQRWLSCDMNHYSWLVMKSITGSNDSIRFCKALTWWYQYWFNHFQCHACKK